jgi:hypothetical protein
MQLFCTEYQQSPVVCDTIGILWANYWKLQCFCFLCSDLLVTCTGISKVVPRSFLTAHYYKGKIPVGIAFPKCAHHRIQNWYPVCSTNIENQKRNFKNSQEFKGLSENPSIFLNCCCSYLGPRLLPHQHLINFFFVRLYL